MPALDLLFYQPAAWEKEPWQQMLTCGGSELDGLHRWCFWVALRVGCAMGLLLPGWWVAALPRAGSPPKHVWVSAWVWGCATRRYLAGYDPACGKHKEEETGDTGCRLPSSFPAVFLQLFGKDGVGTARKAKACPGRCGGSIDSTFRCGNQTFPWAFSSTCLPNSLSQGLLEQLSCKCCSCHSISGICPGN